MRSVSVLPRVSSALLVAHTDSQTERLQPRIDVVSWEGCMAILRDPDINYRRRC